MKIEETELYKLIEGRFSSKVENESYSLFIAGPNVSKRQYGEHFTLVKTTTHEEGSGISETLFGTYSIDPGTKSLVLKAEQREQESWDEEEEAEGEAFIEPTDETIEGTLELEPELQITLIKGWQDRKILFKPKY